MRRADCDKGSPRDTWLPEPAEKETLKVYPGLISVLPDVLGLYPGLTRSSTLAPGVPEISTEF